MQKAWSKIPKARAKGNMKKIISILIFLIFISSASAYRIADVLDQAVPVSYCSGSYELEAIYISDSKVKFRLNNEFSDLLGYHDYFRFKEGSAIFVREILEEEAKEGPDKVSIKFYPQICVETEPIIRPNISINVTEELPFEENVTEKINITQEVPKTEETSIQIEEKQSFFRIIIDWIWSLFKK